MELNNEPIDLFQFLESERYIGTLAKEGNLKMISDMLDKKLLEYSDCSRIISLAARAGHIEIVELMIRYGITSLDYSLIKAAEGGHVKIVKLLLRSYNGSVRSSVINQAKASASLYGHTKIVELMIGLGGQRSQLA